MPEYKRLTARSPKNNMAYLVNVKHDEQDVESPYPNTLRCLLECFERLAQYEDIGSPEEFKGLLAEVTAKDDLLEMVEDYYSDSH